MLNAVLFWMLAQVTAPGWLSTPLSLIRGLIRSVRIYYSFKSVHHANIIYKSLHSWSIIIMDLILLEDGSQRSSGELHRTLPKIRIRKLAVATAMVVAARLLSQPLYSGTERLISTAVKAFTGRRLRSATKEGLQT